MLCMCMHLDDYKDKIDFPNTFLQYVNSNWTSPHSKRISTTYYETMLRLV